MGTDNTKYLLGIAHWMRSLSPLDAGEKGLDQHKRVLYAPTVLAGGTISQLRFCVLLSGNPTASLASGILGTRRTLGTAAEIQLHVGQPQKTVIG